MAGAHIAKGKKSLCGDNAGVVTSVIECVTCLNCLRASLIGATEILQFYAKPEHYRKSNRHWPYQSYMALDGGGSARNFMNITYEQADSVKYGFGYACKLKHDP